MPGRMQGLWGMNEFLKSFISWVNGLSAAGLAAFRLILAAVMLAMLDLVFRNLGLNLGTWSVYLAAGVFVFLALAAAVGAVGLLAFEAYQIAQVEHVARGNLLLELKKNDPQEVMAAVESLRRRGWLTDGSLKGQDLTFSNLRGADLNGARLVRANLSHADLAGADLSKADLTGADLSGVQLAAADLSGAKLEGVNLRGAVLPDGHGWQEGCDLEKFIHPKLVDSVSRIPNNFFNPRNGGGPGGDQTRPNASSSNQQ